MAYLDIPLPGDRKNQSQVDIKNNFLEIQAGVSQDHEALGSGASQGKHKQLTMPAQGVHMTTSATERGIYCKNNAGGSPSLWVQKADAAATEGIDFTTINGNATSGYTMLPSGLILHWGHFNLGTAGNVEGSAFKTIAFTKTFTTVYSVIYSAYNNTAVNPKDLTLTYVFTGAITGIVFTRGLWGANVEFYYTIIGV